MEIKNNPSSEYLPGAIEVKPLEYHQPQERRIAWKTILFRAVLRCVSITIILILIAVTAFSFLSLPTRFTIKPTPEAFDIQGGLLRPKIGETYLLLPGEYDPH